MPVYEYHCDACGNDFEQMQKMSDKPVRSCPACKGRKVHRVISHTSFVLKGTGWYATDYAHKGSSGGNDGGNGGGNGGGKSGKDKPPADSSKDSSSKSGDTGSGDSKGGSKDDVSSGSGSDKPSASTTA